MFRTTTDHCRDKTTEMQQTFAELATQVWRNRPLQGYSVVKTMPNGQVVYEVWDVVPKNSNGQFCDRNGVPLMNQSQYYIQNYCQATMEKLGFPKVVRAWDV